eukprot:12390272-Ditylum_brightwellii.AAC.1
MEHTLCTEDERQLWCDKHSTSDLKDEKELDIRKVPTSILTKSSSKVHEERNKPMLCTYPWSHGTAKVQMAIPSKVMVAVFEP